MKRDLHTRAIRLPRTKQMLLEADIPESSRQDILTFFAYAEEELRLKPARLSKYLEKLRIMAALNPKPFRDWTKEDVKDAFSQIKEREFQGRKLGERGAYEYSP